MNIKIIVITFLIIVSGAIAIVLLRTQKTATASVICKTADGNCTYTKTSAFGRMIEQKEFDFKDVMQCNIETIFKKDFKERNVAAAFNLYIYINYGNDIITFTTKDRDNLADVCSNVFEKTPFSYKFKTLESEEK